jgi:hypothetical protein
VRGPFGFAAHSAICSTARCSLTGIRTVLLAAGILSLQVAPEGLAQTPAANEFQVEAVFLFNFTQFVIWPSTAFTDATDPFVICLLGEDRFGAYLDDTIRGERIAQRSMVVKRYRRLDDIDVCHILFISKSEGSKVSEILVRLQGRNVLSVSDADNFGRRGGMIRFVVEHNHVRLRVNLQAAKAAGLTISSKLLRVVDIVETGKD